MSPELPEREPGGGRGGRTVLFGTRNTGKVRELEALVAPLGLRVVSAAALDGLPEVVEDGRDFTDNALKKARVLAQASGLPTVADDSGLQVDALDGAPGIYSARFSGPGATDARNNALLLERLAGVPAERRTARFRCALAFVDPAGPSGPVEHVALGVCEGVILEAPRGTGGFGYDPLFYVPELGASFAELDRETKNRVSHRARALAALEPVLRAHFGSEPFG